MTIELSCRTCDSVIQAKAIGENGRPVIEVCSKCADRNPVRCPDCRNALKWSARGVAQCACRRWRVEEGRWTDAATAAASPASSERDAPPRERREEPLAIDDGGSAVTFDERATRDPRGYREAAPLDTLEIRVRPRRDVARARDPVTDGAKTWMAVAVTLALVGLVIAFWSLDESAPSTPVVAAMIACSGLVLAFIFRRLVNRDSTVDVHRSYEGTLRVGPRVIEHVSGRARARICDIASVGRVIAQAHPERGHRVIAVDPADEELALVENLTEDEAREIAARIRAHVARLRA